MIQELTRLRFCRNLKLSLNETVTIVKHLLPVINLKAID